MPSRLTRLRLKQEAALQSLSRSIAAVSPARALLYSIRMKFVGNNADCPRFEGSDQFLENRPLDPMTCYTHATTVSLSDLAPCREHSVLRSLT
jgi:hypothetical protein